MQSQIQLGDIFVDVVHKDIKNVHLSVHPPAGRVSVSAPAHMSLDAIRIFVIAKINWIKKQQKKLQDQERESPREYLDRESHYLWGKRYLLEVVELEAPPLVLLKHHAMVLQVRPGSDTFRKEAILAEWYRGQLKETAPPIISKWEALLGVNVQKLFIQHMKTMWGSCNPVAGNIRLNSELAKKPPRCLEYIIVHEMVHLLEPKHNDRFRTIMDRHIPNWESLRDTLNRFPVRHELWRY